MDQRERYSYDYTMREGCWVFTIRDTKTKEPTTEENPFGYWGKVVSVVSIPDADLPQEPWPPAAFRAEYERIIEYDATYDPGAAANLVELIDDAQSFNQPCRFGNLVEGHAVYCHNSKWLYSPRKCRRSWYTGGETRDEDCEGFAPNMRTANTVPM